MPQMFLRVGISDAIAAVLVDVSPLREIRDGFPIADLEGAVCAVLKCQRSGAGKFLLRVNAQNIGEKIFDCAAAPGSGSRASLGCADYCVCLRTFETRPQFESRIG